MGERMLLGCRILVVEDEYFLAGDLRDALVDAGAEVLGPVPSVDEAAALLQRESRIDAAVLDVNLRGNPIFPLADSLRARGVPFAFATGYDRSALPERFADVPRMQKPLRVEGVAATIRPLLN